MLELKTLMVGPPRLWLAVAESLTCGRVQARVGSISGASEFFKGGITTYRLDQKIAHLGVNRSDAEPVNSVSAGIAEQMARGACILFDAGIGLATTGYAEPSAEWAVEQPFAWWAIARRRPDRSFVAVSGRLEFPGASRTQVQEEVAGAAIDALVRHVGQLREGGLA